MSEAKTEAEIAKRLTLRTARATSAEAVAPPLGSTHGWTPFLAFVLLTLAICTIGYVTFAHYRDIAIAERQQALAAIADLKMRQISGWLDERRSHGEAIRRSPFFGGEVERWLHEGAPEGERRRNLLARMRAEAEIYQFTKLILYDVAGNPRLVFGEQDQIVPEHERHMARQTAHDKKILFSDFHRSAPDEGAKIELDMLVPLLSPNSKDARVVGVLYFGIDPNQQLYPLIQSLPLPLQTAESLLVRAEGDEVLFLNELRHRAGTALNLRLPLNSKTLPEAMVARGEEGIVKGVDYRGVAVLASLQRIAGTRWGLVVKVDEAEALAPIQRLAHFAIISILVFIALAGGMVAMWWRQQRDHFAARQLQLELARQQSETDYRLLFERMLNGFALCEIIVDEHGAPCDFRYLEVNPAFERATGLKREEVVGKRVREVVPGIESFWIETYGRVALEGTEARFQNYVAELGIHFEIMAFSPMPGRFAAIFDNVTERRVAEQKVARLTNLYAALSQTNQAIVRLAERESLFHEICRVAVEFGGFKFAWIGVAEADGRVSIAASHGDDQGYLDGLDLSIDASLPQGRGPTGTAIREGRPYIVNDYAADPNTAPWRAALAERGIYAAAAFPLREGGQPVGALTLYATEIDYFDQPMIDLLTEMSTDISFALDNLARKAIQETLEHQMFWNGRIDHALAEVSDIILSTDMTVESVSEIILSWTQALSESAIGFVGYVDPNTGKVALPARCGGDGQFAAGDWGGLLAWVIDQRSALLSNQAVDDARATGLSRDFPSIQRFLGIPASVEGKLVGIIGLANAPRDYDDADMHMTERFAALYAVALNRKWNEAARAAAEERLRLDALVFEASSEGMLISDANNRIIGVNRAFTEITGYSQEELVGHNPRLLKSERQNTAFYRDMWDTLLKSGHWQGELWNRRKNGEVYPEWLNISLVRDAGGTVTHHIGTSTDISSRKLAEDEIYHLTRYDALTGLPNKFLLEYRLTQAIGRADELHQQVGVVMVNLDNFHAVNDSAGYGAGDQLLVKVAQRLSAAVHEDDTVARLGADNFVVVEPYRGTVDQFIGKVERLLVAVAQPIEIAGREIQLTASIGGSLYPDDGNTAMDLIQKAGIAMRHVKSSGGNHYNFFANDMNARAMAEMALSNDLRHAVERDELVLHYQTQVDTFSGEIVGVEALLRWRHPELGLLMPGQFIGLAEKSGLIIQIGAWVLHEACRQMKTWHDAGHSRLFVSVNVSALQFRQEDLAQTAIATIRESGLEPSCVELELTESMLMSHFEQTQETLKKLKAFGVRFSIDDFGTGYSSLSYLKLFPIDKLKIDTSFISDIASAPDNAAIVKAIIAMGRSLELKVIAEGVETEAQAGYLRTIHCDEMQGYYFSRPVPAQELVALLGTHQPVRSDTAYERVLLLVDDEANVISALKRVLRRDGYRILTAASAQEGLELLAKHPVGVILSDQRMPAMTGIEFLSKVKVMYPDIVRLILSGYTEVNTMSEAINRGAIYKFLTKPWEDEVLRAALKEAFLRYETLREAPE